MMVTKKRSSKRTSAATRKKTAVKKIPAPPGPDAPSEEIAAYFSKYSWAQVEKAGHLRPLNKAETVWMNKLATESRKRVEARQNRAQLNLALPADQLARFTQYANKKHIPPSTLARAWILERLDQEAKEA